MKLELLQAQKLFTHHVQKLLLYAINNKIELTLGEVQRTLEQQQLNVKKGVSKTLNSYHLKCTAIDLKVFKGLVYSQNPQDYKALAVYWESLHENNRAGYFWGWDLGHFEMQLDKAPRNW
jgi:peptidoglycan L-alanyl-D-glutamate endopeptidase CwlK